MADDETSVKAGTAAPTRLEVDGYTELPMTEIQKYPMLEKCHRAWMEAHRNGQLPATIDPAVLPSEVIPYLMLLDYLPEQQDVRVRLAGNYVGERTSDEMGGRRLRNFFNERDAKIVFASMERVAVSRQPSLAHRSYVSIDGKSMSYVRLIMPMSIDGMRVSGFFKTIEPDTLQSE